MAPVMGSYHSNPFNYFPGPSLVHNTSCFLSSAILERAMSGVRGKERVGPPLEWAGMEWSNSGLREGGKGRCILNTDFPCPIPSLPISNLKTGAWALPGPRVRVYMKISSSSNHTSLPSCLLPIHECANC